MSELREVIYDRIADGRGSIRIIPIAKPVIEGGKTFLVSFLLNVDAETHAALGAEAAKTERTIAALLKRYSVACFKFFIAADDDEDELKAA